MGLEILLNPYVYYVGSEVADSLGTYINVKKNGTWVEGNNSLRRCIENSGVDKYYTLINPKEFVVVSAIVLLPLYGLDMLVGIESEPINFHKGLCYVAGSVKYICGGMGHLSHVTGMHKNRYLSWIPESIFKFNEAVLFPLVNR